MTTAATPRPASAPHPPPRGPGPIERRVTMLGIAGLILMAIDSKADRAQLNAEDRESRIERRTSLDAIADIERWRRTVDARLAGIEARVADAPPADAAGHLAARP